MKKIAVLDTLRQAVDIIDIPSDADTESWLHKAGYCMHNISWMDDVKALCFLNQSDFSVEAYG